ARHGDRRREAGRHGRFIPDVAFPDQHDGVAIARIAPNQCHGTASENSPGRRLWLMSNAALREVRAWHLSLGGAPALGAGNLARSALASRPGSRVRQMPSRRLAWPRFQFRESARWRPPEGNRRRYRWGSEEHKSEP